MYVTYDEEDDCIKIDANDRERFLEDFAPFLNIDAEKTQKILNYEGAWDDLAISKNYGSCFNLYINIFDDANDYIHTHWERVTDDIITDRNYKRIQKLIIMQEFTLYNDTRLEYEEIIKIVKGKYDFHDMKERG
jgi:tRNA A37 N6-isopentenylltransferase MiaA